MFAFQSYKEPQTSSSFQIKQNSSSQFHTFNMEYQICSKYMKITSEKLYMKELEIIKNSDDLLNKVNQGIIMRKDISQTRQSLNCDTSYQGDIFAPTKSTRSRMLLKRSRSGTNLKRVDYDVNQALKEVRNECSQFTFAVLNNMFQDYKKNKERISSLEKKQREINKKSQKYDSVQQELLLIKKKAAGLEIENKSFQKEIKLLKSKLKEVNQQLRTRTLSNSRSTDSLKNYNQPHSSESIKEYLTDKQEHLLSMEGEIKNIQLAIERSISSSFSLDDSCLKCCSLLKKIKESILKYRKFLEEEASLSEEMYQKYKNKFF